MQGRSTSSQEVGVNFFRGTFKHASTRFTGRASVSILTTLGQDEGVHRLRPVRRFLFIMQYGRRVNRGPRRANLLSMPFKVTSNRRHSQTQFREGNGGEPCTGPLMRIVLHEVNFFYYFNIQSSR